MEFDNSALWPSKSQLGIEIDIVIPGQPIEVVQLEVRQRHHLGVTGVDPVDFIDDTLRYHDGLVTDDPHGAAILIGVAQSLAPSYRECNSGNRGHFLCTDEHMHSRTASADVGDAQ